MPKLKICYSEIYDRQIHKWMGIEFKEIFKQTLKYVKKLQKEWNKVEKKVFTAMTKVSGLKWSQQTTTCFVVRNSNPFSMPLTLPIRKDLDNQIETIIHELVHNLIFQNSKKIRKKNYSKKYGRLSRVTKNHVLTHAILKETLLKIYGEKKTRLLIKKYNNSPEYKKAWEIVEKEGFKRIIKDFIN